VELAEALLLSEMGAQTPIHRGRAVAQMAAAAVPIAEGEQTISATVSLTFAIE